MRVDKRVRGKLLIEEQRLLARLSHEFYMNLRPLQDQLCLRIMGVMKQFRGPVNENIQVYDEALHLLDIMFQDHLNHLPIKLLESYAQINVEVGRFHEWSKQLITGEEPLRSTFKESRPPEPEVMVMGEPESFYLIEEDELPPYEPSQLKPAEIGGVTGVPYARPVIVAGEFDPRAKRYMEELALRKCVTLNSAQKEPVKKVLIYSFEKAEPLRNTMRRMEKHIHHLKFWQIERIARTETHQVFNWSKYKEYQDDPFVESMQWLTVGDNRVRRSHRLCHLVVRRKGEPFPNGLLYPHDPSGPAREVIQCRCTIVPYIIAPSVAPAPRTRTPTQMAPESNWKPPVEEKPAKSFKLPRTYLKKPPRATSKSSPPLVYADNPKDYPRFLGVFMQYPEDTRNLINEVHITRDMSSSVDLEAMKLRVGLYDGWESDLHYLIGYIIDHTADPDTGAHGDVDPLELYRSGASMLWGVKDRRTPPYLNRGVIREAEEYLPFKRYVDGKLDTTEILPTLHMKLHSDDFKEFIKGCPESFNLLSRVLGPGLLDSVENNK